MTMSLCRPSSQLIRRARSSVANSKQCRRSATSHLLRPFHTSSPRLDDGPQDPKQASQDESKSLDKPRSKAPALRKRSDIAAERRRAANADMAASIKSHFKPYSEEELDALKDHYTPLQMDALQAAEKAVDVEDLAEQWGTRLDQWKVDYMDDLSQVDPLVDKKAQLHLSDAPQMGIRQNVLTKQSATDRRDPADFYEEGDPTLDLQVEEGLDFKGLSLIEMLYLVEKRKHLPEKIKAGLRTLHKYKGSHREHAAKKILWRFLPSSSRDERQSLESIVADDASGKMSVGFLFELLEAMGESYIEPVKKYELLAMKHWVGTPKEEALRSQLMRTLAQHGGHDPQIIEKALFFRLKNLHQKELGFNLEDDFWFVEGPHPNLYNNPIFYNAVAPEIPKLKDPRVHYTDTKNEDAREAAFERLARTLNLDISYLRGIRVKQLVMHRVVNQTTQGKSQRYYTLSIAGNENGLLGIGEGKSPEVEDSGLQSYMNALRNLKPIHRYERRTVYGKLNAKSGGTTVELDARPPGFGIRTQSLIFEIARCAGIRDLSARVGRSRNKMNTVKATVQALMSQVLPEDIARARGRKMVDVRKVYYGRALY